jgi:outer membrane protein assembly factor BamD
MSRQTITCFVLACVLVFAGCHRKVQNPMANVDSKQPDKTLFDRSMESMKKGQYQEARSLLETLINSYPDSEYIARAKLAVGDTWYDEGGKTAWQQAEVEYKDFQTFFPNMPEAAEAQLKVANMHYLQMEKADRDYSEAQRAADEYKALIQHYPDSSLVPQAKQKLREVQEDLAERQFRIAHFYYLRQNMAASQARLESLIDSYPLYSGVDEALFELGAIFEREAAAMRRQTAVPEARREAVAAQFQKHAIDAYSRIITRYPAKERANDARHRLEALNAPVPVPTPEALAESKAEEQSRHSISMTDKLMGNFKKRPNLATAPGTGEPNMSEEEIADATKLLKEVNQQLLGTGTQKLEVTPVAGGSGKGDAPGANQPPPGSAPATSNAAQPASTSNGTKPASGSTTTVATAGSASGGEGAPPAQAPPQMNEIKPTDGAQASGGTQAKTDSKQDSTSQKKKKKGLRKLIPF